VGGNQDVSKEERGLLLDGINDQQDVILIPNRSGAGGGGTSSELSKNVEDTHGRLSHNSEPRSCWYGSSTIKSHQTAPS
jgi:hypothetical protein